MKKYLILFTTILISCTTSGYKQFYTSYVDTKSPEGKEQLELLKEDQMPEILGTSDFDKDTNTLFLKSYIVIGESSFNGAYEDISSVATQAKSVGATIVLVDARYTNTLTVSSALFVPTTTTTYHSGSATHSGSTIYSSYSSYPGSVNATYRGNTSYSGTSTTHGTQVIPYTKHHRRYDQHALFFVKKIRKSKLGMLIETITDEQKANNNIEFGVYISSVTDGLLADRSNIVAGDILYKINNENAYGTISAEYWIEKMDLSSQDNTATVIRDGREITLLITQEY